MKDITKELVDFVFNLRIEEDGFHSRDMSLFNVVDEITDDIEVYCNFTDSVFIQGMEITLELEDGDSEFYDVELDIDDNGILDSARISSINGVDYERKF